MPFEKRSYVDNVDGFLQDMSLVGPFSACTCVLEAAATLFSFDRSLKPRSTYNCSHNTPKP